MMKQPHKNQEKTSSDELLKTRQYFVVAIAKQAYVKGVGKKERKEKAKKKQRRPRKKKK